MFFGLSKLFWAIAQPLNALCLLGLAGLLLGLRWKKVGQGMARAALILILAVGILPIGPFLFTWLERQYPPVIELPARIDGIIVLGGAFEAYLTKTTGQVTANDQIERLFCFVDLGQKNPAAKMLYSGGSGDIMNQTAMEGDDARAFFSLIGFDREVLYEEKSRNTYENVLYSREMMNPAPGENWVVVTSGYHMPRAMGIFEKQGWNVIPYPCDLKTDGRYDALRRLPNVAGNYQFLNLAVKEIIGSIVYYVTGKSAFILPPASVSSSHEIRS
jgi:uncharacterized SAM-binding protein YcdF (DUF218 family)